MDNLKLEELNAINKLLMESLNNSGKIFLSHTKLNGTFVLRIVIGQTEVEQRHIEKAWNLIVNQSKKLSI